MIQTLKWMSSWSGQSEGKLEDCNPSHHPVEDKLNLEAQLEHRDPSHYLMRLTYDLIPKVGQDVDEMAISSLTLGMANEASPLLKCGKILRLDVDQDAEN